MKTIQLTIDCFLIRLYNFLNFHQGPSDAWDLKSLIRRYPDSCALKARFIFLILRAFFVITFVAVASTGFGTGLWAGLYILLWLGMWPMSLYYNSGLDTLTGVVWVVITIVTILASLFAVIYFIRFIAVPWFDKKFGGKITASTKKISASVTHSGPYQSMKDLYYSIKDKYCAKLEVKVASPDDY